MSFTLGFDPHKKDDSKFNGYDVTSSGATYRAQAQDDTNLAGSFTKKSKVDPAGFIASNIFSQAQHS